MAPVRLELATLNYIEHLTTRGYSAYCLLDRVRVIPCHRVRTVNLHRENYEISLYSYEYASSYTKCQPQNTKQ